MFWRIHIGSIVLLGLGCRPSGISVAEHALSPLAAAVSVDDDDGAFPHRVVFDASESEIGSGDVTYEWSFGDGTRTHDGPTTVHTYVGAGEFVATLTLTDQAGRTSSTDIPIDVDVPDCPDDDAPLTLGDIDDDSRDENSGIVASRIDPGAYWIHGDVHEDEIFAVDLYGDTLSEHELPVRLDDIEDIAAVVDPSTGAPVLFVGDIGDNDEERAEVSVWILEEPNPFVDGDIDPMQMRLTYPDGARNAETLLVDPFTLDIFVLTKESDPEVFVKRAPHAEGGPFELDRLGQFDELEVRPTGGDVSPDGLRVVLRGYGQIAYLWMRDGYRPLEEAFENEPCRVDIADDDHGEAITFSLDGRGVVTTTEGEEKPLYFIGI